MKINCIRGLSLFQRQDIENKAWQKYGRDTFEAAEEWVKTFAKKCDPQLPVTKPLPDDVQAYVPEWMGEWADSTWADREARKRRGEGVPGRISCLVVCVATDYKPCKKKAKQMERQAAEAKKERERQAAEAEKERERQAAEAKAAAKKERRKREGAVKGVSEERFNAYKDLQQETTRGIQLDIEKNHKFCVAKNDDLWKEFGALDEENKKLGDDVFRLQSENSSLNQRNAELEKRVQALEEMVQTLQPAQESSWIDSIL
jgi:hypothetical protein